MPSYQLAPSRDAPRALGRYELLGQLATGGMAEIHLARLAGEAGFEKVVVVKRLLPELVASPTYVEMFLDEGKLVSRLDHPNICEVFELGRDGAEYYLAMPYLDGVPVHELIARPRDPDRMPQLRVAAGVIVQACEGLHHAHELRDADGAPAHLVHRDISPSNLFATAAGVIKVLDFGIAKVRGAAATEVGMIKGKQQYMAPEQLLGEPVDRRCDVFALGIVLYELATHQRLFKRASDYLAARAILEDPIPRADASDPAVPPALADVIEKALQRAPADRYATAKELGAAVADAIPPATPAEIAAMVTTSEELSAQRTRQAKVLDLARSKLSEMATLPMRAPEPPTVVTPASRSKLSPLTIAYLTVLGTGAILVIAWILTVAGKISEHREARERLEAEHRAALAAPKPDAAAPRPATTDIGTVEAPTVEVPAVPHPARSNPPPRPQPAGLLSIDSTPYATIFIDGKRFGVTPLVKRKLPAGRHTLRAVLRDGRKRELKIDVPAGKLAPPIQLTW